MELTFWLLIGIILYVYIGYPLILTILASLRKKSVRKKDIFPSVSILIPAFNEEEIIEEKIKNCLSLDYPKDKLEIIVGSDGATDRTNEIVKKYHNDRVMLNYQPERKGKCAVLYRCVQKAKGDIIVFSDADAIFKKDALKKLVRNFHDRSVGCVEGVRRDANPEGVVMDSLYWKYETFIKKQGAKMHSLLGATGAIYGVRKSLYDPISEYRGDDFEIPIRVALKGYGVVLEPEAVAFHPWLSNRDEFDRIVRIVSWMIPSAMILLKEAILKCRLSVAFQLISHKILRWMVPLFLLSLFIVNLFLLHKTLFLLFFLLQILFYVVAFIGYYIDKKRINIPSILKIPYFFCLMNGAAFVGIIKFFSGKHRMTWKKTAR